MSKYIPQHELVNYTYIDRKGVHYRWKGGRWVVVPRREKNEQ